MHSLKHFLFLPLKIDKISLLSIRKMYNILSRLESSNCYTPRCCKGQLLDKNLRGSPQKRCMGVRMMTYLV